MTAILALGAVIFLGVAWFVLHKMHKHGPPANVFTFDGCPIPIQVSGRIPHNDAVVFARAVAEEYKRVWPCLQEAYSIGEFPNVDRIDVLPEAWVDTYITKEGKRSTRIMIGETYFLWPRFRIHLAYSPDGPGAIAWELRNVARVMAHGRGLGEFDPAAGDDAALNCIRRKEDAQGTRGEANEGSSKEISREV